MFVLSTTLRSRVRPQHPCFHTHLAPQTLLTLPTEMGIFDQTLQRLQQRLGGAPRRCLQRVEMQTHARIAGPHEHLKTVPVPVHVLTAILLHVKGDAQDVVLGYVQIVEEPEEESLARKLDQSLGFVKLRMSGRLLAETAADAAERDNDNACGIFRGGRLGSRRQDRPCGSVGGDERSANERSARSPTRRRERTIVRARKSLESSARSARSPTRRRERTIVRARKSLES